MSKLRLCKSATSEENAAALDAVKSAAPFFKLPEEAPKFVDIEFAFSKPPMNGRQDGSHGKPELFTIAPYLLILQDKIGDSWTKPSSGLVTLKFLVHEDGALTDSQIIESSDTPHAEKLALAAVEKASPLDLPPGLPDNLWVQVTFDPDIGMATISEVFVQR